MSTQDPTASRAGVARVPRSRGAASGLLLVLLGIWGGGIPFVGPYWHFAYPPDSTWTFTAARGWYEVAPGVAAIVAGLLLLGTSTRVLAIFAGTLASLAGAWYVLGPVVSPLISLGTIGTPLGGTARQVAERVAFFSGIGVAILFVGAVALGRLSTRTVRDLRAALAAQDAERRAAAEAAMREEAAAMAAQPTPQEFLQMPAEELRDEQANQTAVLPTVAAEPAERSGGAHVAGPLGDESDAEATRRLREETDGEPSSQDGEGPGVDPHTGEWRPNHQPDRAPTQESREMRG